MLDMETHYDILGVTRLSSSLEIKQAYRRKALHSHPDKAVLESRDEATKKFQDVQVAYDVLSDPMKRRDYDDKTFGEPTPPGSYNEQSGRRRHTSNQRGDMPPSPESPDWGDGDRYSDSQDSSSDSRREFRASQERPKFMPFVEASVLFHPEDRRHLWLCSDQDDPADFGGKHLFKNIHCSLQEIFSQETVELTIFRYRYLPDSTKVVELIRRRIKLKPFLSDVVGQSSSATIDLEDMGNEFPPTTDSSTKSCKQYLSITPVDESILFGENYDGQFFRANGSACDVTVHHTISKSDQNVRKGLWWFELDIPALSGRMVIARFKGRLRKGRFTAVLRGEGMWKWYEGGERGDLLVRMDVT